ncbi:Putative FBD-associated F-box protein At5g22720 [Linum grandiflorum]
MMENQPKNTTDAAAEDLISKLPDEILYSFCRHIPCPKQSAQTAALSSRWRNLWRSYTAVEFNSTNTEDFQEFVDATMEKFAQDELLQMQALKVSLDLSNSDDVSSSLEQLLDLASKKKADAKTLHLEGIKFEQNKNDDGDLINLSLESLLHLHLESVVFPDGRLFASFMATSSPLLETLEITGHVYRLSKLNVPKLKTLKISSTRDYSLSRWFRERFIAPQLTTLEIDECDCYNFTLHDVCEIVSKFENLKSLTLVRFAIPEYTLTLSCPKLEEFTLGAPALLRQIELHVKPCFRKFVVKWCKSMPDEIVKCEIHDAAVDCVVEVDFTLEDYSSGDLPRIARGWFASLKMFMIRFPQFHTIFSCWAICREGKTNPDEHPLSIEHLKITARSTPSIDDIYFLHDLFRVCDLRFLTVGYEPLYSKSLLKLFLDLASYYSGKGLAKNRETELRCYGWLHQLKDVKIKPQDEEQTVDIEDEIKAISERMATSCAFKVCFELTW